MANNIICACALILGLATHTAAQGQTGGQIDFDYALNHQEAYYNLPSVKGRFGMDLGGDWAAQIDFGISALEGELDAPTFTLGGHLSYEVSPLLTLGGFATGARFDSGSTYTFAGFEGRLALGRVEISPYFMWATRRGTTTEITGVDLNLDLSQTLSIQAGGAMYDSGLPTEYTYYGASYQFNERWSAHFRREDRRYDNRDYTSARSIIGISYAFGSKVKLFERRDLSAFMPIF